MNMQQTKARSFKAGDYRSDYKPVWCPGCGDHTVLLSLTKALADFGAPPEETVVVSGIGCSSRIPAYTNCYGFHGVHGRALPIAAGIKLARPDLTVLAAGGDGDGYSIGGNHFLHAARRNVDLTYVVMDNQVYGMTKGQPSPTTLPDWDSALVPGGTGVRPFHPLVIALAAGANFVGRGFSGDPKGTANLIVEAMRHPGFSFVELLSPCVTFRPEQKDWKGMVHSAAVEPTDDVAQATRRILTDDGFNLGILYRGDRAPYQPKRADAESVAAGAVVANIEAEFQA
jgi:2-oxoglutarate ferredoxin oxidoreductase subunit beta